MGYIEYFLEIRPDEINPNNIEEFIKKKKEERAKSGAHIINPSR